jgi:predicted component of type VI protein secretion system
MQSNFRMVMRAGPTVGKVYPMEKSEMFVGRDLSNDVVINDPEISRRHARFFQQGNSYVLEDLGSTNGTFVNSQRLMGPNVLRPGDTITFGERMSLVFESAEFDQDATMVSPAGRPSYGTQQTAQAYNPPPAYQPPQPVYQQQAEPAPLPPIDNYAGQVPAAYAPEVPPQKKFPLIWIVIIVILLLTCLCLGVAAWIAPKEFWCLFPVFPAGYCP